MFEKFLLFVQNNKTVVLKVGLALAGAVVGGAAVAMVRRGNEEFDADPRQQVDVDQFEADRRETEVPE